MSLRSGTSPDTVERLETLHATGLLETGPVAAFDRLTRLARRLITARMAAVTLIDSEHQWLVSADGPDVEDRQIPLSHSFCRYVVRDAAPLIVADARVHPLLHDNPAIAEHDAVAYAGYPLRAPDGAVLGAFCVVDSERREWSPDELAILDDLAAAAASEVALRLAARQHRIADEQHVFLQAVLDSLDAGVAACDGDGRMLFFNQAMRGFEGEPAPELTSSEWPRHYQLYTPDGHELVEELPLARALAGEVVRGQQLLAKRKRGWLRLVSNARPIRTADGRRLGAVVAVHDMTEAYRAEELRRARHAVAQVLSDATNARDASIQAVAAITDSLGWSHGEYWQVSEDRQHIERHSAHASGDRAVLPGDRPLGYVRGEGLPGLVWARNSEVWWNTGTTPEDMVAYGRALPEAGIRVAVGVPVRSGRRTLGVLAFYTDQDLPYDSDTVGMLDAVAAHLGRFVERRWAEDMSLMLAEQREQLLAQERQQVEQLRSVDRMKDELAALVIHELRNPVGVIRGFSEMLVDSTSLADQERQHAAVIERTALHLQGLVDDLLDLARLNAGHLSIDARPTCGGRLVRDVIENHMPSARAKRLTVEDRVAGDFTVHADSGRLRQALDNLISNAIKYTPEGGTVAVAAEQRGDRIVIEVSDTGIGIPAEQYAQLFSRFFRASNATDAGIKGTGLGLAVTKAIVDAHGGTIAAGPAPGGGTTFTVSLPVSPP